MAMRPTRPRRKPVIWRSCRGCLDALASIELAAPSPALRAVSDPHEDLLPRRELYRPVASQGACGRTPREPLKHRSGLGLRIRDSWIATPHWRRGPAWTMHGCRTILTSSPVETTGSPNSLCKKDGFSRRCAAICRSFGDGAVSCVPGNQHGGSSATDSPIASALPSAVAVRRAFDTFDSATLSWADYLRRRALGGPAVRGFLRMRLQRQVFRLCAADDRSGTQSMRAVGGRMVRCVSRTHVCFHSCSSPRRAMPAIRRFTRWHHPSARRRHRALERVPAGLDGGERAALGSGESSDAYHMSRRTPMVSVRAARCRPRSRPLRSSLATSITHRARETTGTPATSLGKSRRSPA